MEEELLAKHLLIGDGGGGGENGRELRITNAGRQSEMEGLQIYGEPAAGEYNSSPVVLWCFSPKIIIKGKK